MCIIKILFLLCHFLFPSSHGFVCMLELRQTNISHPLRRISSPLGNISTSTTAGYINVICMGAFDPQ